MSMHLCGPALTTTGKKKGKFKFRNAEEARRARELDAEWKELLKRQGVEQEARRRLGVATLAPAKVYTGTKVKGIATMHKSNAVPVFSDEEAVDISRMRR